MLFMAFRKVQLFAKTLIRFLRTESYESLPRALSRTLSHLSAFEKINLTEGVFFSVPKAQVWLWSIGAGGSEFTDSTPLSFDQAKQLFRSIELAYDRQEVAEINVGDLSWKTDCRVKSNPDIVTVTFDGPQGRTRIQVRRRDMAAAIAEFGNRFETK
jgi:hypothetical protein